MAAPGRRGRVVARSEVLAQVVARVPRPELVDAWDLVVWVHADDAVRLARMAVRDGVPDNPEHPDQRRYLDAQAIYRRRCRPDGRAEVVVDNTDPERLRLVRVAAPA